MNMTYFKCDLWQNYWKILKGLQHMFILNSKE